MLSQIEIKQILYTSLLELGLKEQEIELYALSLAIGPTSIGNLASQLGINRPNIYKVIIELEKKGLAKFSERKKYTRTFMVESPTLVRDLLKQKKENLTSNEVKLFNALPDLLALYHQGELPTSVKIIEGEDQFLKVFFQSLDEAQKQIEFFGSAKDFIRFISWGEERRWIQTRVRKNIFIRTLIFDDPDALILISKDKDELRETRLFQNITEFNTSYLVYGHKVIIWQPQAPLGILIEDQYIVKMFLSIFNGFWDISAQTITAQTIT